MVQAPIVTKLFFAKSKCVHVATFFSHPAPDPRTRASASAPDPGSAPAPDRFLGEAKTRGAPPPSFLIRKVVVPIRKVTILIRKEAARRDRFSAPSKNPSTRAGAEGGGEGRPALGGRVGGRGRGEKKNVATCACLDLAKFFFVTMGAWTGLRKNPVSTMAAWDGLRNFFIGPSSP